MRRTAIALLLITLLIPALTSFIATASPSPATSSAEAVIQDYFQARREAVTGRQTTQLAETVASRLQGRLSPSSPISDDEANRMVKLRQMEARLGITVIRSYGSAQTTDYAEADGTIKAKVYDWTFYDYDENGSVDTFGVGTWHDLTLVRLANGALELLRDDYDEGPLTEVRSSTATGPVVPSDSQVSLAALSSISAALSSFRPDDAAGYADLYVYTSANGGTVYESYYNDAYKNYNSSGGDCANFVSQCLYFGGIPMVGSSYASSADWWYNNKGTASTGDDTASQSWTYVPTHRLHFASVGQLVNNPTSADILKGNPVYMDWTKNGGYDHATICVGKNAAGTPIINCHNNDYYHAPWNYSSTAGYSTVKLPGTNVALNTPNGGENWQRLTQQFITWDPGSVSGSVKVDLSLNGGSTWSTIIASTPNSGSATWTVSASATTQAKIRIVSLTDASYSDSTDGVFQISNSGR